MTRTGKCRQLSYCEINNDRRRWCNLQVSQGTSLWLPVLHNDFSDIALEGMMYMTALKRASVTGLWAAKTFIGGKLRYHVTVLVLHSWVTAKERRSLVHCCKRMVSARVLCVQCPMVFGYAVHFCVWCRHARDFERRQRAMFSSFCVLHMTDSWGTHSPLSVARCLFDIYLDHMHILFLAHIATECVCVHISVSILHLFPRYIFFRSFIFLCICFCFWSW